MHTPEAEIPASPFPMRYNTKATAHSLNAVCVSAGMSAEPHDFVFVCAAQSKTNSMHQKFDLLPPVISCILELLNTAGIIVDASQVVVAKSQAARIESEDDPYNSIRSPPTIRCHSLTTKTKTFFLASCWHSLCNCARRQEAG